MKKWICGILLCFVMLPLISAGGGQTRQQTAQQPQRRPPVTVPLAQPITLNVMARADNQVSVDWDGMGFWQLMERETNVKVNWDITVGADDYFTKLNMAFISGTYPDVFMGFSHNASTIIAEYGVQQGLILRLDDYFNNEYLPNYYGPLSSRPMSLNQNTAADGHMYVFGRLFDAGIPQYGVLIMNHKLLTDNGIRVPNANGMSFAEFEQTLRSLKAASPDIIPLSMQFDEQYRGMSTLAGIWGKLAVPGHFTVDNNDRVYCTAATPEFRSFIEWLNMAYREGLVDLEFISQDVTTYASKVQSRRVGFWISHRITGSVTSFPNDENEAVVISPPLRPNTKPEWRFTPDAGMGNDGASVTITNRYISETMAWLNNQYKPINQLQSRFGVLGMQTEIFEGRFRMMGVDRETRDHRQDCPAAMGLTMMFGDQVSQLYTLNAAQLESVSLNDVYRQFWPKHAPDHIWRGSLQQSDSEEAARLYVDIKRYIDESLTSFIMNGVTDTSWNAYLGIFRDLRVDRYIELMQKQFENYYF